MRGLGVDAQDLRAHLQAYGCGALVRRRLDSLSRGQARRVYLAAAFLGDPPVIVLDEPTNDLDVETTLALSTWVTQAAGRGSAVLVSSHVLGFLDRICHHVTLLRDGLAAATLRADQEDTESVYRRVFALRQLP